VSGPDLSDNDSLETRARDLLNDSVDHLDARTRSKLTQARHAALQELQRPHAALRRRWIPATSMAAAAVLAVLISFSLTGRAPSGSNALLPEDFELLADAESLEMMQDMEFYAWLDGESSGRNTAEL